MKRLLCPELPKPGQPVELPESEARHALHVLRLRNGDLVEAMNGQGQSQITEIKIIQGKPFLQFTQQKSQLPRMSQDQVLPIELNMAVLKGEAMEWTVEKAVELGVKVFCPIVTTHSVVQIQKKGPEAFQERWQKIADQALKQCGRLERMIIELPSTMDARVPHQPHDRSHLSLFCNEAARDEATQLLGLLESSQPIKKVTLWIGPEGGWSQNERTLLQKAGHKPVSLGPLVFRAETAALFSISVCASHFRLENLDKKTQK